ncbi:MAG: ABC transporter ATP-binding protein [Betaproteobacteria bacterium]|nr:ABC transporter ATP-binding protein [Betaproteobacteria bacterium]
MPAGPESPSALELRGVAKSFGRGTAAVQALRGVDARIPEGSITGLFGPDGAGKTTLIRLGTGLLRPDAGELRVFGAATGVRPGAEGIGYMPQRFGLYDELSVLENLRLHADLQGLDAARRDQRFDELLRLTALGPFGSRRAGALSGGMRQKLGLACALLRQPRLLLLDEPTVGVDPISRRELWDIIAGMRRGGSTVLVSTAYLDEAQWCDHIVLLQQGRVLRQGTPRQFVQPLRGRCFEVAASGGERRALQLRLQRRAGVLDALVQGDGVRVLLEAGAAPGKSAGADGAGGETWSAREPVFEDAFVDALRRPEAPTAQPRSGASSRQPPAAAAARRDAGESGDADAAASAAPRGDAAVIEVRGLQRRFGDFVAVSDVSFEVHRGEVFGLLGANGAGKSTTFRMLCGLLAPSAGSLRVVGADMRRPSPEARARIGYVAQRFALYTHLSVAQNLEFFASAYGLRGSRRRLRLQWAREEFDLEACARVGAGELAQGYRQRLALACALMHEPGVLFLDEPTSGVDPLARREFWQRINALAARGVTVLVTTHFMDEAEYCDRLVLMSRGSIVAGGSPREVRELAGSARPSGGAAGPAPDMAEAFIRLVRAHEAGPGRAGA